MATTVGGALRGASLTGIMSSSSIAILLLPLVLPFRPLVSLTGNKLKFCSPRPLCCCCAPLRTSDSVWLWKRGRAIGSGTAGSKHLLIPNTKNSVCYHLLSVYCRDKIAPKKKRKQNYLCLSKVSWVPSTAGVADVAVASR